MIDMNILDNILSTAPPFPLLPLESLLKALHIFIGGFIQFDVQYRLTLSLTFEHPLPFPLPQIEEWHTNIPIIIRNIEEFNDFITIRYQDTLSMINLHWNNVEEIGFTPGEPGTSGHWDPITYSHWDPNRFHIHRLSVSLIEY